MMPVTLVSPMTLGPIPFLALVSPTLSAVSPLGWWKSNHNVHHIVTNDPEHDPDIQHMPFIAVSVRFMENLYSTYYRRTLDFDSVAKFFIPFQHRLFTCSCVSADSTSTPTVSPSSQNVVASPHRWFELTGIAFFWCWYAGVLLRSLYPSWSMIFLHIMVAHVSTVFLHVQITLSHFGMDTSPPREGETYAELALRTTMDVECPEWFDWFHGGLQFQVEHHLFPRVPRHNLRKIRGLVVEFARDNGLEFHTYGFVKGNALVFSVLQDVAGQV
ncbi:fatty acid desaturase, partial [Chytridium lagenaria]